MTFSSTLTRKAKNRGRSQEKFIFFHRAGERPVWWGVKEMAFPVEIQKILWRAKL